MIGAVVEHFGDGVAGEKPDTRVFESAGLVGSCEQRRDVVAQAEAVAVQKLHRVEHFAGGFLIGPAGDVIPEAGFDVAAVGQKEAPDGFGFLARRRGVSLFVNTMHQRGQIPAIDLPLGA